MDIIEHLAIGGHGDKAEQLFSHLQKGIGYNQDVCHLILRLLNKGHEDTAKKIMKTMPKSPNAEETPFKGAFFVKQLLKLHKDPDSFIKSCRELQEENLVPSALYIATEGALQHGYTELAQKLFNEIQKDGMEIRQHYFWPLLAQKGKEGDEEGLLQIVRDMSSKGIIPTGEALRDYVIPHLKGKDTEENIILKLQIANVPVTHSARNLIVELLDSGEIKKAANIAIQYRPRGNYSLLARPLLNALNKTKDINSFVTILHVISSVPPSQNEEDPSNDDVKSEDKGDANEVGRIVRSAVKNLLEPNLCEKLLTAVHSKGIRISTKSAEEIEQFLDKNLTSNLSELLAKLTSSELEMAPLEISKRGGIPAKTAVQLENLLTQMKAKDSSSVNRIQRQLLSAYVKENNLEKMNVFLPQLRASDFEVNVPSLAQLFEFYCQNDDIEKASEIHKEILQKDPEFVLNKHKLVQMAFALVRAKKYDEAKKFLMENKHKDDEGTTPFTYNSKVWQMLNCIAEQKEDVEVSYY